MRYDNYEIKTNKFGTHFTVVERVDRRTLVVKDIDNDCLVGEIDAKDWLSSRCKCISPYDPIIEGKGYLGIGEYEFNSDKKAFRYFEQFCSSELYEGYSDLLNYQQFMEWYLENYYEVTSRKDNSELGCGGRYRISMKLCKVNNQLVFLPSDLAILVMAKVEDYIKKYESNYKADTFKVNLPQLNKSSKILKDVDGDDYYKFDEAKTRWKNEMENHIRTLADNEDTAKYLVDIPTSVLKLLMEFTYTE